MRALASIAVLTVAGAAALAGCGADREEDERQNLAILHELPTVPGARELEVSTAAYYGDEEGPFDRADGHTTSITYRAPDRTTRRELVRFYVSRLEPGWKCEVEPLDVICTSDTASISVNPDNLTTGKSSFDVVADHRGGSSVGWSD